MSTTDATSADSGTTMREHLLDLAALYQMYQNIDTRQDRHAAERSGLFSTRELAAFHRIDGEPEARHALQVIAAEKEALQKQDEMTLRLWADGRIETRPEHELREVRENVTEQLNSETANILGAVGVALGQILFDDPAQQTAFGRFFASIGEMGIAHGEALKIRAEEREFIPTKPGLKLYSDTETKGERLEREGLEREGRGPPAPGQNLPGFATYRGEEATPREDGPPRVADPSTPPNGPELGAGASFDPGAAPDAGASFDPGAAPDAGASFDPGAAPDAGASFDPGAVR
jgi:hypothetical protein